MARDVTASIETEYEPSHEETDDRAVIGESNCHVSDDPFCMGTDDSEMRF